MLVIEIDLLFFKKYIPITISSSSIRQVICLHNSHHQTQRDRFVACGRAVWTGIKLQLIFTDPVKVETNQILLRRK